MNSTPQPIKQVSIIAEKPDSKTIRFYGTPELASFIRQNGYGRLDYDESSAEYELVVSPLYHYEQVAGWLKDQEAA